MKRPVARKGHFSSRKIDVETEGGQLKGEIRPKRRYLRPSGSTEAPQKSSKLSHPTRICRVFDVHPFQRRIWDELRALDDFGRHFHAFEEV